MQDDQDILEMSTGVKLRIRQPSAEGLRASVAAKQDDEPQVPRIWIESDNRYEENPNDPDYVAAKLQWQVEGGIRGLEAMIASGTALVDKPDDVVGPEDPDYGDMIASMGIVPAPGKYTRWVQWVKLVACSTEDLNKLGEALTRALGVSEEDVADAVATFRRAQGRGADPDSAGERHSADGDHVSGTEPGHGAAV